MCSRRSLCELNRRSGRHLGIVNQCKNLLILDLPTAMTLTRTSPTDGFLSSTSMIVRGSSAFKKLAALYVFGREAIFSIVYLVSRKLRSLLCADVLTEKLSNGSFKLSGRFRNGGYVLEKRGSSMLPRSMCGLNHTCCLTMQTNCLHPTHHCQHNHQILEPA